MNRFRSFIALLLVISIPVIFCGYVNASGLADQSGNLFVFQKKLAARGNAQAQYAVGFMYEMGKGVKANKKKAIEWYKKAVAQSNDSAIMRLTYLKVKEKGYQNKLNNKWLREVESEASANKQEAMFLLGQLYHKGIGVKKDLARSAKIMNHLSMDGYTAADVEIKMLQAETRKNRINREKSRRLAAKQLVDKRLADKRMADKQLAEKKLAAKQLALLNSASKTDSEIKKTRENKKGLSGGKEKPTQTPAIKITNPESVKKAAEGDAETLKRKNYEAVMRKLAKEQAQIDKLQGWAEGKKKASVDDEL